MPLDLRALLRQLHNDPHDLDTLEALRRRLVESGRPAQLSRVLEWWATFAPDDAMASQALLDAARCITDEIPLAPHALTLLTHALWRDPGHEQAASAIRDHLEALGDFDELERTFSEWALAVRREGCAPTLCALASFTLAHLRVAHAEDLEGGISALEDALRSFPEHPDAKRSLAALYARRAEQRARDCRDHAAREDKHRAAQLFFELGMFDVGESATRDLARALDLVPEHTAALEALLRRLGGSAENRRFRRQRLQAYVAHAEDRVRTHRHRFELVRTLFRDRRYADSVPHLSFLAQRGYAEAHALLERLSPRPQTAPFSALPSLPLPPTYDEEHTQAHPASLQPLHAAKESPRVAPNHIDHSDYGAAAEAAEEEAQPPLFLVQEDELHEVFDGEVRTRDVTSEPADTPAEPTPLWGMPTYDDEVVTSHYQAGLSDAQPTAVYGATMREAVMAALSQGAENDASGLPSESGAHPIWDVTPHVHAT